MKSEFVDIASMQAYCNGLLEMLWQSEEPAILLQEEAEKHYYWAEDEELDTITEELESFPLIWRLCNATLERLCQQNLSKGDFYERAARFLLRSDLFVGESEQSVALLAILSNPRVPYRQFVCERMPEEEFESRIDAHRFEARLIHQVAFRSFPQKTQRAHAVLEILNQCDDMKDQEVLLALLLDIEKD